MNRHDDQVRVTVHVDVSPALTFKLFTEHLDAWWQRGVRFRHGGASPSALIRIEPEVNGRLLESFEADGREQIVEIGRVTVWHPPVRLVFSWRAGNFSAKEETEVEVTFEAVNEGTQVTVVHSGWAAIRPDHPVRHGQAAGAFLRTMGGWWGDQLTSLRAWSKSAVDKVG